MAGESSLWTNNGGIISSAPLSKFLRFSAQPMYKFRQFADVKDALGKNTGESFNWDKISDVATPGGSLTETSTMPLTQQTITKGTLTITEYGNAIPYTFKLEALSQFDMENVIRKGLLNDKVAVIDAAVHAQFNVTPLYYVGTTTAGFALTTNGTATATNTSALNEFHIRKMKLELEKRNVPTIDGDSYVFVGSLEAVESLQGSMVSINQYNTIGYEKILNGEQGVVDGVRIVKDNNATRYTYDLTARTKTAKSWSGALSLEGFMFGGDTVTEAMAVPEEVRAKEVTDFGRSKGVAWYFLGGWKITWDTAGDARIIKWASLA